MALLLSSMHDELRRTASHDPTQRNIVGQLAFCLHIQVEQSSSDDRHVIAPVAVVVADLALDHALGRAVGLDAIGRLAVRNEVAVRGSNTILPSLPAILLDAVEREAHVEGLVGRRPRRSRALDSGDLSSCVAVFLAGDRIILAGLIIVVRFGDAPRAAGERGPWSGRGGVKRHALIVSILRLHQLFLVGGAGSGALALGAVGSDGSFGQSGLARGGFRSLGDAVGGGALARSGGRRAAGGRGATGDGLLQGTNVLADGPGGRLVAIDAGVDCVDGVSNFDAQGVREEALASDDLPYLAFQAVARLLGLIWI